MTINPISNLRKGAVVTLTTLVLGGCESTAPLTQEEEEYVAEQFSQTLFFTPLVEGFAARADSDKIYGVDGTTGYTAYSHDLHVSLGRFAKMQHEERVLKYYPFEASNHDDDEAYYSGIGLSPDVGHIYINAEIIEERAMSPGTTVHEPIHGMRWRHPTIVKNLINNYEVYGSYSCSPFVLAEIIRQKDPAYLQDFMYTAATLLYGDPEESQNIMIENEEESIATGERTPQEAYDDLERIFFYIPPQYWAQARVISLEESCPTISILGIRAEDAAIALVEGDYYEPAHEGCQEKLAEFAARYPNEINTR